MKAAARFAACLLLTVPLYRQRQPYTLTVDVDLVVLNVRVLDKSGQSMHALAKENFYIEEDGKTQNIDLFIAV